MTTFHKEEYQCPYCLFSDDMVIWDSINAQEDPDLKDKLLLKKLQTFECNNCGRKQNLAPPILYVDRDTKTILYYNHSLVELFAQKEWEEYTILPKELSKDFPLQEDEFRLWRKRLCTSYNDLIEKIHIADAQLDDRLIEIIKIAVSSRLLTEENRKAKELRFLASTDSEMLFVAFYETPVSPVSVEEQNQSEDNPAQVEDEQEELRLSMELYENTKNLLKKKLESDTQWSLISQKYAMQKIQSNA